MTVARPARARAVSVRVTAQLWHCPNAIDLPCPQNISIDRSKERRGSAGVLAGDVLVLAQHQPQPANRQNLLLHSGAEQFPAASRVFCGPAMVIHQHGRPRPFRGGVDCYGVANSVIHTHTRAHRQTHSAAHTYTTDCASLVRPCTQVRHRNRSCASIITQRHRDQRSTGRLHRRRVCLACWQHSSHNRGVRAHAVRRIQPNISARCQRHKRDLSVVHRWQ